jgi:Zn ribbon nucleic-acid-binding protein
MAKYRQCPNCGNEDEAHIYRCNKCGKVFCSDCGKTSTSVFNWLSGMGGGRCPSCDSNDVASLGSIGSGLFRLR